MEGNEKKDRNEFKKVRREGGSTVLAMGKIIPPDWKMVRLSSVTTIEPGLIVVWIEKVA